MARIKRFGLGPKRHRRRIASLRPVKQWSCVPCARATKLFIRKDCRFDFYRCEQSQSPLRLLLRKIERPSPCLEGEFRLISLELLKEYVCELSLHVATCEKAIRYVRATEKGAIKLVCETQRSGLASVFQCECEGCHKQWKVHTSPKMDTVNGQRYDVNVRAVWGQVASGGGCYKMNEFLSTMGVSGMSKCTFSKLEHEISQWWQVALDDEMKKAGEEEVLLAKERGDYHEGVPATSVVVDGGWSKRTHKHTYNALGGAVIVIGVYTKKILSLQIRNKYCYTCSSYTDKNLTVPDHVCFKNWDESSQSMEADGALVAFSEAENQHGLRYLRIVADGDSSVMATLLSKGPAWCRDITKIKCPNHACKRNNGHDKTTQTFFCSFSAAETKYWVHQF